MEHAAETGFSPQRGSHNRGFSRGFKSKNPFTLSIAQGIRNNRTPSVQRMDDISLPSHPNVPGRLPPRQSYGMPHSQNRYYTPQPGRFPGVAPHPVPPAAPTIIIQQPSHNPTPMIASVQPPPCIILPEASSGGNSERNRSRSRDSWSQMSSTHSPARRHHSPSLSPPHLYRVTISPSPTHGRSRSFSRGRSRSARHRQSFEIPPRSSDHHSTNSTSAQTRRYRIPESSPGRPVSPHSPAYSPRDSQEDLRIDDRGTATSSVYSLNLQRIPPIVQPAYHTPVSHSVPPTFPSPPGYDSPTVVKPDPEEKPTLYWPRLPSGLNIPERDPSAPPQTEDEAVKLRDYVEVFLTDTLPRIFKDADLTLEEIKEMALQASAEDNKTFRNNMPSMGPYYYHPDATNLSPMYHKLKTGWENFIDSLMREWKTLNLISVLLLSAIMTMFQIQGASGDPVTRYIAFWSLICALLSLLYGCLFIIRFASMRKAHKAAEWALEARNTQTVLWNVWVMLAMPVIWLAWSIITYIACIMSFMWRVSANVPSEPTFSVSPSTEFGFRIFICTVLGTGIIYGILIINTFRRYGAEMDEAWERRVESYIMNTDSGVAHPLPSPRYIPVTPLPKPHPRSSESDPTRYVGATNALDSLGRRSVIPVSDPGVPPPIIIQTKFGQSYQRRTRPPSPTRGELVLSAFPQGHPPVTSDGGEPHPVGGTPRRSRSRSHSDTSHRSRRRYMQRSPSFTQDTAEKEGRCHNPSPDQAADLSPGSSRKIESTYPLSSGFSWAEKQEEIPRPAELIEVPKESMIPGSLVASDLNIDPGITLYSAVQPVNNLLKSEEDEQSPAA